MVTISKQKRLNMFIEGCSSVNCPDVTSHVHTTFWLGIEQCSNRRWNLVPDESLPDLYDTHTRYRCQKNGNLWRWFLERVSWVLVFCVIHCTVSVN